MFYCGYDPGYEVYIATSRADRAESITTETPVPRGYLVVVAALIGLTLLTICILGLG